MLYGFLKELADWYSISTDQEFARRLERGAECVHPRECSSYSSALNLDCGKSPTCLHDEINLAVALSPVEYLACTGALRIG